MSTTYVVSQGSGCHDCEGADIVPLRFDCPCFNLAFFKHFGLQSFRRLFGFNPTRFPLCLPFLCFHPFFGGESRSGYCYCKILNCR